MAPKSIIAWAKSPEPRLRGQRLGERPDLGLGGGQRRGHGEKPRHHALDIAVDRRCALAEGDCRDGGGGIVADARQPAECGLVLGEPAPVPFRHHARASMQVARTRVIAEAGPGGEHLTELGARQCRHVRPAAQEEIVARQHRLDRRLLQHDLAEPYAVRIGRLSVLHPPRQAAALAVVPGEHGIGDAPLLPLHPRRRAPLHKTNSAHASVSAMV